VSPIKARNEENGASAVNSDTKNFSQLQSHRQDKRQSFSPPFRGFKVKEIDK